jgi:hypothetical protein
LVSSSSRLWGAELNFRKSCWHGCYWNIDFLAGYRHLALDENFGVMENLSIPAGAPLAGAGIFVQDHFGTHNNFNGGQVGLDIGWHRGRWSLDLLGKVALGNMHEVANISGSTIFTVPGMPANVQTGGLYALPTNIGQLTRDRFAVVPEAGVKVGLQITPRIRATVGYTFLYTSEAARAAQQIDRIVNTSQLPSVFGPGMLVGVARPAPGLHSSDFWAQGLTVGLEFRY